MVFVYSADLPVHLDNVTMSVILIKAHKLSDCVTVNPCPLPRILQNKG